MARIIPVRSGSGNSFLLPAARAVVFSKTLPAPRIGPAGASLNRYFPA
ncbi:hypothetical protein BMS3Bbin14_01644 [bacterium BMS3Bbin14]|nr:hypothetical protein BMS3Abin13_01607 [bacterium BMS3Abin13]GBE53161.1 hypothetical protein BMS3Bbin14_01644 [bacterium BMS3Bbin14]